MVNSKSVRVTLGHMLMSTMLVSGLAVTASAQTADDAAAEQYAALLDQISNTKILIEQKNAFLARQQAEIASLEKQIAGAEALNATVDPMLKEMAQAIEGEIAKDLPFKPAERYARLDAFQSSLADEAATPGEKMRKGLNIYAVEVGYGQNLEAYNGDNPLNPGTRIAACRENPTPAGCGFEEDSDSAKALLAGATPDDLAVELQDGTYLRYGRMALSYMQQDGSEGYRYDPESKEWVKVSGNKLLDLRGAIRIARGEAAPGVVTAPIYVTN